MKREQHEVDRMNGLAGYGKTMLTGENIDDPHVCTTGKHSRRMLKKAVQQGRSE